MFISCTQSRKVRAALILKVRLSKFAKFPLFRTEAQVFWLIVHKLNEILRAGAGDCTKSEETTCHVCAPDENALITRIMSKKLRNGLKEFAVTVPLSRSRDYSRNELFEKYSDKVPTKLAV